MNPHSYRLKGRDFVHQGKIEIDVNERAVFIRTQGCFFVHTNSDCFLNSLSKKKRYQPFSKMLSIFFLLFCHCPMLKAFPPIPAGTSQIIPAIFDTLHPGVDLAVMSETKGAALPLPQHTERYRQTCSHQNAVLIISVFP